MNVLCVLAREPAPGMGKSRLRAQLGDAATDALAVAFAGDVLGWAADAAEAVLVAHTGSTSVFLPLPMGAATLPQASGDLGVRIAAAVDAGFAQGATRVVIVGTDCPTLPVILLRAAFAGLTTAPSTLVPALDGGWIALGVDRPLGGVLDGVCWSSPLTGEQTAAALRADGRPPLLLEPWYDVDEAADLDRIRSDPSAATRAPRTAAVLAGMRTPAR